MQLLGGNSYVRCDISDKGSSCYFINNENVFFMNRLWENFGNTHFIWPKVSSLAPILYMSQPLLKPNLLPCTLVAFCDVFKAKMYFCGIYDPFEVPDVCACLGWHSAWKQDLVTECARLYWAHSKELTERENTTVLLPIQRPCPEKKKQNKKTLNFIWNITSLRLQSKKVGL